MRILITGSREWTDKGKIEDEVEKVVVENLGHTIDITRPPSEIITIVHGHCPKGADSLAEMLFCGRFFFETEKHPADWTKYGKAAGPIRNQEMVKLGADICLAFICQGSTGTRDCIERAWKAGIPVRIFPEGAIND